MSGPLPCPWCLSTPPHHERCEREVLNPHAMKVGTALDSVGATVPTYDRPTFVPCPCDCQQQAPLW